MNIILKILKKFSILFIKTSYGEKFVFKSLSIGSDFKVLQEDDASCPICADVFNSGCSINCCEKTKIGGYCVFRKNVKKYDHNQIFSSKLIPFSKQNFSTSPMIIGNNIWIGSNCTILKAVSIGNNVMIGTNCLIYMDVPDNSIAKNKENIMIEKIVFCEEQDYE